MRSWLYVDDAARGICLATERGQTGKVYNLGTYLEKNGNWHQALAVSGTIRLVIELAHAIQREVDSQLGRDSSPVEFVKVPDRPYNDMRYLIDIAKMKEELGWEPEISFEEGRWSV